MSVCSISLSVVDLIARYKAVSSAKSLTLDLSCSGRSFMYAWKRIGPGGWRGRLGFFLS